MKSILLGISLLTSFALVAQVEGTNPALTPPDSVRKTVLNTDPIAELPDIDAQFPGGAQAMRKYIMENVRYPEYSREHNEQGRVYLSFVVEKDGSISGIEIPRSLTPRLDEEAIRLISSMPKWKPGELDGAIVRSRIRMPITFTLN